MLETKRIIKCVLIGVIIQFILLGTLFIKLKFFPEIFNLNFFQGFESFFVSIIIICLSLFVSYNTLLSIQNKIMKNPKYGHTLSFGMHKWFKPKFYFGKQEYGNVRPQIPNDDGKLENVKFCGVKFDFGVCTMRRPIPKFYKKDFWLGTYQEKAKYNPWNSGNHWFVLTIPWVPYFFFCALLWTSKIEWMKQPGFYFGCRTAYMNEWSHYLIDYTKRSNEDGTYPKPRPWIKDENGNQILTWGTWEEHGNCYGEFSATLRNDFTH